MSTIIETLKKGSNIVLPKTTIDAVYDLDNHRLSESMLTAGNTEPAQVDTPIDADLLDGRNSSYYINTSQITNPNLLDNPWFTINQRGQSSYTSNGYTVDRWYNQGGGIEVTENGVKGKGEYCCIQRLEPDLWNALLDKTVTISVLLSSGQIYTASGLFNSGSPHIRNSDCEFYPWGAAKQLSGAITNGVTVRAVKLELGSVSTLAMDTAPNYATELLKCQRYYQRYSSWDDPVLVGFTFSSSLCQIRLPMPMRTVPAVTVTGSFQLAHNGTACNVSSIIINNTGVLRVNGSSFEKYYTATLFSYGASSILELSADL